MPNGYVAANGVNYYYEIHGKGEPLLLLHGGLGSTGLFEPDVSALSKNAQVIAVDLYGHGRTALTDRSVSPVDMGDDMATILQGLGVKQADAMGRDGHLSSSCVRSAAVPEGRNRRTVVTSAPSSVSALPV